MFSLGTLKKGSGPETFSGLGLVGLDRGDICHIIPNLQHCTVLLTIEIGGTLANLHQTVLYHTIRNDDKMYQDYVLGLVVLDRKEVLVRKRAGFYYGLASTMGLGSTTGRSQGGILTLDVRSTQAKATAIPLDGQLFKH